MTLDVAAQADTSRHGGYIPLFDNLTSPDVPLPNDYNGKIRLTKSGDSTEVSIEEAVQNIRALYNAGRYSDALMYAYYVRTRKLDDRGKFTREETENLRKYSIAAFKEVGYDRKADSLMELFCNHNPFYKVKDDDPDAFVKLKDRYVTRPWFAIRLTASHVYPVMKIDTVYTIRDKENGYRYGSFSAVAYETAVAFYPSKKWEVLTGIAYTTLSFKRMERGSNVYFSYEEDDKFYSIPLEVGYSLPSIGGVLTPEIYAGAKYTTFFESKYKAADLKRTQTYVEDQFDTVRCAGKYNDVKNSFLTVYGGAKFNCEFRRFVFFVGVHYGVATKELRKPENKYKTQELIVNHHYVPEAMRLNQISVNFGFKVNLFYRTTAKYGYGY